MLLQSAGISLERYSMAPFVSPFQSERWEEGRIRGILGWISIDWFAPVVKITKRSSSGPIALLAAGGVGLAAHLKNKQLQQEKERLYKEVLAKHTAIIKAMEEEINASKERLDYLQSLNILLQQAIKDLRKDLGVVA